jgi:methionyl-tRNA formyltransferase
MKEIAGEKGVPVFQPESINAAEGVGMLCRLQPDLLVVAAYGQILSKEVLSIPTQGAINVHGSLLPKYRGAAPVHRAVMAGEAETGITIMRVVKALDAGGMFAKTRRPIGVDETSAEVERDLAHLGAPLLMQVIEEIVGGTAHEEPQDERLSTYAPRLTRDEGLIDWTRSASVLHDRVRGLYPWPHAYTFLEGVRLIVLKSRPLTETTSEPPGTVVGISRDEIAVTTGEGCLSLLELQPEGRRGMRVRDYLAGRPLSVGARLTGP